MTPQQHMAAENVAYRFEDQRYSVADEDGDHCYTRHTVKLLVYPLLKRTKCGIWIGLNYAHYPTQPRPHDLFNFLAPPGPRTRFVNLQANKKFALPTVEEAYTSYLARKNRQISIYAARIKGAEAHIEACQAFCWKLPASLVPSTLKVARGLLR